MGGERWDSTEKANSLRKLLCMSGVSQMDAEDEHPSALLTSVSQTWKLIAFWVLVFLLLISSHVDARWPITPETIVFSYFLYREKKYGYLYRSLWVPLLYLVEWGGWFQISYNRNYT